MELNNRYDFVYLFDVQDGNPNGDPDAGNLPRIDTETGMGLVTDVCLKRKVRNYVSVAKAGEEGYDIFIREKAILNNLIANAYKADEVAKLSKKGDKTEAARDVMCRNYFDVRTFGAVMSTGENAGQVRGPIQLTFARSIEPVTTIEHSITRMAVATEKEAESQSGENRTMGRKSTIPYGLYICHGFISANLAKQTGFTNEDLQVFWNALQNMFDVDRSASRGLMSPRKLIVFKHSSELGNAPAHVLFDLIDIKRSNPKKVARSFEDYEVIINRDALPQNVEIEEIL